MIKLHNGDCIEFMRSLPDNSIDMCLTDPPYGTTACKWDSIIPFEPMWAELKRVVKDNGAIVLFGSQPFTSALIMSNIKMFRSEWFWNKVAFSNQMMAKFQQLRIIENIIVFSKEKPCYYPQGLIRCNKVTKQGKKITDNIGGGTRKTEYHQEFTNYPKNLLQFSKDRPSNHPTQKPVALLEYLIKTYTLENETVLDFTMGSGSTGVACVNTGRSFIGCELEKGYFDIAENRINNANN